MTWHDALPVGLPGGRLITPVNGTSPVCWLSSQPVAAGVWAHWRRQHAGTGLWPLLAFDVGNADRPFEVDAEYDAITTVEQHDGPTVLAEWWREVTLDEDGEADPELVGTLDPIGIRWPGITPRLEPQGSAEDFADEYADVLSAEPVHLALVPATDGAHALTALGWAGPLNHDNDTAKFAAVVRDWQPRFGATVVGLGFDTLYLSVAAPPTTQDQAARVAAEHLAFCPDNIWQSDTDTLADYAEAIMGMNCWTFWWD